MKLRSGKVINPQPTVSNTVGMKLRSGKVLKKPSIDIELLCRPCFVEPLYYKMKRKV